MTQGRPGIVSRLCQMQARMRVSCARNLSSAVLLTVRLEYVSCWGSHPLDLANLVAFIANYSQPLLQGAKHI